MAHLGNDGFNLWIEVTDERAATRYLREHSVGVCPGAPFFIEPDGAGYMRITCASVEDGIDAC